MGIFFGKTIFSWQNNFFHLLSLPHNPHTMKNEWTYGAMFIPFIVLDWFQNDAIFIVQGLQDCVICLNIIMCSVDVCRYLNKVLCCSIYSSCDEHRGAGRSCVEVTRPVLCCAVCCNCVLLLSKQNGVQEFQYIVQYNWSIQCGYSFQWIFWAWLWNTWNKA